MGPYSYGYDPYYRNSSGYYVPPGYELVSTRQLDDLRAASRLNTTPMVADPARATEVQRREEEVWQKTGRASGAQCAYAYAALLDLDQHSAECAYAKSVRNDDVGTSLQIVCDKGKEVGQTQEATALAFI